MEIVLSLISSICLGLHNGIAKKPLQAMTSTQLFFYRELVLVALMLPVALLTLPKLDFEETAVRSNLAGVVFAGFIGYFVIVLIYKGIRVGNPGLVGAVSNSYLPPVMLLSWLVMDERLSPSFIWKASVTFLGVLLVILPASARERQSTTGVLYGVGAVMIYSVMYLFFKPATVILTPVLASFLMRASGVVTAACSLKLTKQGFSFPKQELATVLFLGVLMTTMILSMAFALSRKEGHLSLVVAIIGANPMVTIIYSHYRYKLKISGKQLVGVLMAIAGIALLSIKN